MSYQDPLDTVREFWRLMASNNFSSVAAVLAPDFILEWPQSRERVRGAERFARLNQEYPAHGPWQFEIRRLIGSGTGVVSEVAITDGVQSATAISFFTVREGRICHLLEYWPDPYPAPANRAHLVEHMD